VPRAWKNLILVLVTGLGWGLLAPASKVLFAAEPRVYDGLTVAVARAAWALPFFLIGLGAAWRLDPPRLDRWRWGLIVAAGLVFGIAVSVLYTVAAQHTSVAHIAFLVGISPVTNTAVAAVVFRTGLDRRGWAALGLGVAGVALLAAGRGGGGELLGDALMVAWLAGFAAYACLLRAVGPGIS
jgi:drug/metabolite transporter (DMT)-like permease